MRVLRYERILAGTALAVILATPAVTYAQVQTPAPEAGLPAPQAIPPLPVDEIPTLKAPTIVIGPAPAPGAAPAPMATPAPAAAPGELPAPQMAIAPAEADPLAALDPIAEKMRDLLAAKTDRIFANRAQRSAAEAFYQKRNYAPLWLEKGVETARASAVIATIKAADADGLDPRDYKLPTLAADTPD